MSGRLAGRGRSRPRGHRASPAGASLPTRAGVAQGDWRLVGHGAVRGPPEAAPEHPHDSAVRRPSHALAARHVRKWRMAGGENPAGDGEVDRVDGRRQNLDDVVARRRLGVADCGEPSDVVPADSDRRVRVVARRRSSRAMMLGAASWRMAIAMTTRARGRVKTMKMLPSPIADVWTSAFSNSGPSTSPSTSGAMVRSSRFMK